MTDDGLDSPMQAYYLRIKESGHQFTRQKERILQVIMNAAQHISAKEIYDVVKYERISPATIYRTLHLLNELEIVQEVSIKGKTYYELKLFSKKPVHLHLKCLRCQRLFDLDHDIINVKMLNIFHEVEQRFQVKVNDSNLILMGLCQPCKEEVACQGQSNIDG